MSTQYGDGKDRHTRVSAENASLGYLEGGRSLAITRHGGSLGFFIPAQKRNRKAEVEAMRDAAKQLDAMIASWGASEDELISEYKEIRQAARVKKRNGK